MKEEKLLNAHLFSFSGQRTPGVLVRYHQHPLHLDRTYLLPFRNCWCFPCSLSEQGIPLRMSNRSHLIAKCGKEGVNISTLLAKYSVGPFFVCLRRQNIDHLCFQIKWFTKASLLLAKRFLFLAIVNSEQVNPYSASILTINNVPYCSGSMEQGWIYFGMNPSLS